MIVDFSVENYLSIKNKLCLSLLANSGQQDDKNGVKTLSVENEKFSLLPFIAIYGPNASGKSNIIKAFSDFVDFILFSHRLDLDQPIPIYKPFKLDNVTKTLSIKFEIEFIVSNVRYLYSLVFGRTEILREELFFYPGGRKAVLFQREAGQRIKFGGYFKGEKKGIEKLLLPNRLFLSSAANFKNETLIPIYRYFRENYNLHVRMDSSHGPLHNTTMDLKKNEGDFEKALLCFLNAADLNIKTVKLEEDDSLLDKIKFPDNLPEKLRQKIIDDLRFRPFLGHTIYNNGKPTEVIEYLDLESEESTGTIKMYDLAGEIFQTLKNGGVLFIDEFNSGLHPFLNKFIVELFVNPQINRNRAQLIVSTHDTCILDLEKIRRDQIWFTDKDISGATELFSLDEFDKNTVRANSKYAKWYMDGRFKAVPVLDYSKFEFFWSTECQNQEISQGQDQ